MENLATCVREWCCASECVRVLSELNCAKLCADAFSKRNSTTHQLKEMLDRCSRQLIKDKTAHVMSSNYREANDQVECDLVEEWTNYLNLQVPRIQISAELRKSSTRVLFNVNELNSSKQKLIDELESNAIRSDEGMRVGLKQVTEYSAQLKAWENEIETQLASIPRSTVELYQKKMSRVSSCKAAVESLKCLNVTESKDCIEDVKHKTLLRFAERCRRESEYKRCKEELSKIEAQTDLTVLKSRLSNIRSRLLSCESSLDVLADLEAQITHIDGQISEWCLLIRVSVEENVTLNYQFSEMPKPDRILSKRLLISGIRRAIDSQID